MKKEKSYKVFLIKLWMLISSELIIIGSFFVYGFNFNIWGKDFSQLPKFHSTVLWGYIFAIIVLIVIFIRFIKKNVKYWNKERFGKDVFKD